MLVFYNNLADFLTLKNGCLACGRFLPGEKRPVTRTTNSLAKNALRHGFYFLVLPTNQLRHPVGQAMSTFRLFVRRVALLPVAGLLLASSCTLRETRQEGTPVVEPRLNVRAVEQASLGTLNVLPLRTPADVDLPRRNQLIDGYVNKSLPLKMRLQLNVYNPNLEPTTITGLDYTVLVDNKELGAGRMSLALELPPRDSVRVPFSFEMNTYKLLGTDALPALRNFALGFGDLHRPRVTLRLHPIVRNARGRLSTLIRRGTLPLASRTKVVPAGVEADSRGKAVKPVPQAL